MEAVGFIQPSSDLAAYFVAAFRRVWEPCLRREKEVAEPCRPVEQVDTARQHAGERQETDEGDEDAEQQQRRAEQHYGQREQECRLQEPRHCSRRAFAIATVTGWQARSFPFSC